MNQHNCYGYIQRNVNRKAQKAASLLSFQLQFEVIVLAISSEQWPGERANVLCQVKLHIISSLLWMYPQKITKKQLKQCRYFAVIMAVLFDVTVSQSWLASEQGIRTLPTIMAMEHLERTTGSRP